MEERTSLKREYPPVLSPDLALFTMRAIQYRSINNSILHK
jgi:hypothetical protein